MTYPGDMWIVAFVIDPLIVLAGLAIVIVLSDYASRRHDAERAAESKEFCDRMSGKRK